ncbi:MAG TPA: 1,4-alpha-glucan branching protein, partial [Thermoanaerobaculia bacterium]|nr:1,4-alpha-glucan branching protein [Thermoanaerobaculia bacterium]
MPTSQQHVDATTPLGARLTAGGATFRCWAPRARAVHVLTGDLAAARDDPAFTPAADDALVRRPDGTWAGFVPGVADGTPYLFWVDGEENAGLKRDPYARELGTDPPFPDCDCLVRDPGSYPWHDQGWRPPAPRDLVIYQLHVGVFHAVDAEGRDVRGRRPGKLLDLVPRLPYLVELGVNAIQPLPVQEYPSEFSLGYNGTDYFSPESDYQVEDEEELARHLAAANALLAAKGRPPLALADLRPGPNQLKAVVDLCHLHGIAVIFDVVYNHAGGGFDDRSLYRFDRHPRPPGSNGDGLYFSGAGWAGGLVFDFARPEVRRLLIDNALFLLDELHADGFRYDEVTVIDHFGGWSFAQELSAAVRAAAPHALQIAEYWNDPGWRWLA